MTRNSILKIKKFSIELATGYTSLHAAVYLLASFSSIALFVFLNSTQSFVLKDILNVPTNELGYNTGSLVFYDELLSLFLVTCWGVLSDSIGKYLVFGVGFIFTAIALFLYTFATTVYPQLLLYRLIFAIGGAACSSMMTAVLADLAYEKDRGKLAGLVGFTAGLGAIFAVFVLLPLPTRLGTGTKGLQITYFLTGGLSICVAIVLILTTLSLQRIKSANDELDAVEDQQNNSNEGLISTEVKQIYIVSFCISIKKAILAAKDPKIMLGYASSFLARSDSVSITLFIPLWVFKFYLNNNMCPNSFLDSAPTKESCNDAYIRASILAGVTQVFSLLGAPVFADKFYRPLVVFFASCLAGLGYFFLALQTDPTNNMIFIFLFLIGVGEIGLIVTSLGLVTHSSIPQDIRGSVSGLSSFFGALGILVCSKLGGYFIDHWFIGGAYMLLAIIHCIFTVIAFLCIYSEAIAHGGFNRLSFQKMKAEFQHTHME